MEEKDQNWSKIAARHAESLAAYVQLAEKLSAATWSGPASEDKWSPIEITEHLRATYAVVLSELDGGSGMRVRIGSLKRFFIRLVYLPRILRERKMPPGMNAPSEIRPNNCIEDQIEALRTLQEFGTRVQDELGRRHRDPDAHITHHLLGKFRPGSGPRVYNDPPGAPHPSIAA